MNNITVSSVLKTRQLAAVTYTDLRVLCQIQYACYCRE